MALRGASPLSVIANRELIARGHIATLPAFGNSVDSMKARSGISVS